MGFLPSFCRALILLHKQVGLRGPLLTLGNQDVWADYDTLTKFFQQLDCPYIETRPLAHTSRLLAARPEAKEFVHARTFFAMMGITDYCDLDKFEIDSPQMLHDLNIPIPPEWSNKFNLIIDSGTIEHIFDVRQVMANVVNMCRESGWVVHISPLNNWIDHGFYCFSPCFFYDFYKANGFDHFVGHVLQVNLEKPYEPALYFEYKYGMDVTGLIDPARRALILFAAKKVQSSAEITIPTQGAYDTAETGERVLIASSSIEPQHSSIIENIFPKFLLPLLKPLRPSLGALRRAVNPSLRQTPNSQMRRL
jgi:hypothetical protein